MQTSWPSALNGTLFAYRTSKQSSTGFSPFYLTYGRQAKLPIECYTDSSVDLFSDGDEGAASIIEDTSIDADVKRRIKAILTLRGDHSVEAHGNIEKAQEKQKRDYHKRHTRKKQFSVGEHVLLWNLRRSDRKGGRMNDPWLGPFTVTKVFRNGTYELANSKQECLKKKQHGVNLKHFNDRNTTVRGTGKKICKKKIDLNKNKKVPKEGQSNEKKEHISSNDYESSIDDDVNPDPEIKSNDNESQEHEEYYNESKEQEEYGSEKEEKLSQCSSQMNSETQDESDLEMEQETGSGPAFVFKPTEKEWREYHSERLSFGKPVSCPKRVAQDILGVPEIVENVAGDGNCFFRALSREISAMESNHSGIRNALVKFMTDAKNAEVFETYSGREDYVNDSAMGDNGVWATDVEIVAASTLLQTDTYVYTSYGDKTKWLKYGKLFIDPDVRVFEGNMYFTNIGEHFKRVVSCSKN